MWKVFRNARKFAHRFSNASNCRLFSERTTQTVPSIKSTIVATKLCLEKKTGKCSKRSFSFEKFGSRELKNDSLIIRTFSIPRNECLEKCQEEQNCRAVFYDENSSLCQISKISVNSVYNPRNFFKSSKNVDMYENNCLDYSMSATTCTFMRVAGGGLTNIKDQTIRNIRDFEECEQLCLVRSKVSDPCRSYTFDNSTSECHLMWASSRLLGKSPLENMKDHLAHGDLDDCMNFSLKCKEKSIEVKASSMKMFVGKIMTKKERRTICETKIEDGKFDFSSKFDFDECGLRSSSGVVFVKEGSTNLVTIRDKILQVNCRMHLSDQPTQQSLSVRMKVADRNRTDQQISDDLPARPSFSLKILSSNSSVADAVEIGELGWLVLDVKDAADDFTISNLLARDVNTGNIVRIMDEDGCVIRRDIIQKIHKSPNQLRLNIRFGGFQRQTEVVYLAKVETCSMDCMPRCNSDLLSDASDVPSTGPLSLSLPRKMVRRSTDGPRQLELVNDVYEVRGHRLILLNPRKFPAPRKPRIQEIEEDDVIIVKKSATLASSFRHCFIDDITCLFTIVLASVQLFLLFSCCLIMYCYFQQWRQIRQLNTPVEQHVEYYRFDGMEVTIPKDPTESEETSLS